MKRKIMSVLLALLMLGTISVPQVSAIEITDSGSGSVPVILTAESSYIQCNSPSITTNFS